jgi:glucose/arabinose dehydrogenase
MMGTASAMTNTLTTTRTILLGFLLLFQLFVVSNGLPTGFIAEVVAQTKATTGEFVPNPSRDDRRPMLVVINKDGEVHAIQDPDSGTDDGLKILDLTSTTKMCRNGERGMQSIAFHPNFINNRYVYVYYNQYKDGCLEDSNTGPKNVVARYTMNQQTLLLENEEILLEGAPLERRVHNAGAMVFGVEGYLYVTTGDSGTRENASNLKNLHGSLLRIKDDGSIPDDNRK